MDNLKNMLKKFQDVFNDKPLLVAYAPGRINVIGEHTDYNNCPVFPFAVDKKMVGIFSPRKDNKIVIYDLNDQYGYREFTVEKNIEPYKIGDWGNYPKASAWGIVNDNKEKNNFFGYNSVIFSDVPSAGGMSSSTAFVVLSGIMFCESNKIKYSKIDFAELMASSEKFVGTAGGGMDQAACILGEKGKILKIDFNPLRVKYALAPDGWTFVVADTLKKAPKTKSALLKYNSKSIECKLATAILNILLKDKFEKKFEIKFLADLNFENCGLNERQILKTTLSVLKKSGYTYKDLSDILKISIEKVQEKYCRTKNGEILPEPKDGFMLYKKVLHVLTEWSRVLKSFEALNSGNIKNLGKLMKKSHISCKYNHEVTCEELDFLVKCSLKAGAVGARMTGAGFGGCIISLVKNSKVKKFIEAIETSYYKNYFFKKNPDINPATKDYIFVVTPENGAYCQNFSEHKGA